ncbi:MAG: prephenate dehydrogenase/arogenate dehydrogenase family protein [Clostridia bacterium]|nr:prephenate dehydrogenase/arogenate dehydrogenase family protein [Clostridia bacterium]
MTIGIVGLGLIGGSLAKAASQLTDHRILAFDKNESVLSAAIGDGVVGGVLDDCSIPLCDILIVCLFPRAAVDYINEKAPLISKECILTDCCGVKGFVVGGIEKTVGKYELCCIGGHPMAGLAKVGYENSVGSLFEGASIILTPVYSVPLGKINALSEFYRSIGFSDVVITTPAEHDRMIAFTSQLAHVLSNAYVKSPCALRHKGYSAGSFKDLTRVAWLNEHMWAELFMENREALSVELGCLIDNLSAVRNALESNDENRLRALLKDGREQKEGVDRVDNYKG